jgi:hypothetical protein
MNPEEPRELRLSISALKDEVNAFEITDKINGEKKIASTIVDQGLELWGQYLVVLPRCSPSGHNVAALKVIARTIVEKTVQMLQTIFDADPKAKFDLNSDPVNQVQKFISDMKCGEFVTRELLYSFTILDSLRDALTPTPTESRRSSTTGEVPENDSERFPEGSHKRSLESPSADSDSRAKRLRSQTPNADDWDSDFEALFGGGEP